MRPEVWHNGWGRITVFVPFRVGSPREQVRVRRGSDPTRPQSGEETRCSPSKSERAGTGARKHRRGRDHGQEDLGSHQRCRDLEQWERQQVSRSFRGLSKITEVRTRLGSFWTQSRDVNVLRTTLFLGENKERMNFIKLLSDNWSPIVGLRIG